MRKLHLLLSFVLISLFVQSQVIPRLKITDIEKMMTQKETVLVINFWATFCKPCVAEIPHFISIAKKYEQQKVKLLLVSVDLPNYYPGKISAFAKKYHFNTNIAWLNETDADYFCPKISTKWSGAIPATIMINTKTGYKKFFEDELSAEQFETALKLVIAQSKDAYFDPVIKNPQ